LLTNYEEKGVRKASRNQNRGGEGEMKPKRREVSIKLFGH